MNEFTEIIKRRSIPGLLILSGDRKLLFFNDEALDIISLCFSMPDGIRKLEDRNIPRDIYSLCNRLKEISEKEKLGPENSNCVIGDLNGSTGFFYSVRACHIRNSRNECLSDIMVLIERITEKRFVDLKKIKAEFNLTERESEVTGFICKGFSNKDMSKELLITEGTVKIHIKNIMAKMNAASRCEIIARCSDL